MPKTKSTYGFTDECRELLVLLAHKLGVTRTAVIEIAVREKAQKEGVDAQSASYTTKPDA
jgi:hypothetical protein